MIEPMPGDIFQPGQILNNTYEVLGVLGRGGTGEVYLARNQVVDRQVAIKALNSEFSGNADYVELMKREEEMRDIIHEAVVRYSECSRSDQGHVFLVMEYVDGVSLNDLMMDRRIEDRELLIVAHRVLEGLVPVHAHGMVHRDLSPDNIILRDGAPERATIIDFGIAKDTNTGARTIVGNDFAGKYEYAAPEQLDGRSDFQTDLYALGASLLAAYRRDIPFLGATPGEIIRRKQDPLDTEGLRPPLKDLIDWLAAPKSADRPRNAQDALDRMNREFLKTPDPGAVRGNRSQSKKKKRGGLAWIALPVLAAVAGLSLWFGGFVDGLFAPELPVANPYELTASLDAEGATALSGHAPDPGTAAQLQAAFAQAAGQAASSGEIMLATGLPSEDWPDRMTQLLALTAPLEDWQLEVSGRAANLTGLAPDATTRDAIQNGVGRWASQAGIVTNTRLTAGPRVLATSTVQQALQGLGDCGPITQAQPNPNGYALFDTITLTGNVADQAMATTIETALAPVIGDRKLRIDTVTLNKDLCAIRGALPPASNANLSIQLVNGGTGQQNLTGVFTTNQNPVVDVLMPATLVEGSLWVMVVDNSGKVFHILPNVNRTTHQIDQIGSIENGLRRIRVLFSIDEFKQDTTRLAMRVTEGDYGKSEVIAILTKGALFDLRRPKDESVTSVSQALVEAFAGREGDLIGVASRVIDARP